MTDEQREIERLEYTIIGIMHFVDKWFDTDAIPDVDEVQRAGMAREITLKTMEALEAENRRLTAAVEEAEQRANDYFDTVISITGLRGLDHPAINQSWDEVIADRDLWKDRAEDAEYDNKQWNDSDCNTCPLRGWSACEEICESRSSMAEHICKLADDIDLKLKALQEAEADRDREKARADAAEANINEAYAIASAAQALLEGCEWRIESLERALRGLCFSCLHRGVTCPSNVGSRPGCETYQFDVEKFAVAAPDAAGGAE